MEKQSEAESHRLGSCEEVVSFRVKGKTCPPILRSPSMFASARIEWGSSPANELECILMAEVVRLSEEEVLRIRRRLATVDLARKSTFGKAEPMFPDRLSSAVARQWTANGQTLKYIRLAEVAATLFYGIAMSHAFENGNKRTAMMALFVLLDRSRRLYPFMRALCGDSPIVRLTKE